MLKLEIPIEIPPAGGHPKGENRPWHERYVMLDYLTTIAARLMAFEMLICHKSGNDMPCSRLLSDLLPVLVGCHSGKLLETLAEIALVAHAYQLME